MSEPLKAIHDPEEQKRLRALSEEITELLKKHDVCGYLLLQARNTCDFRMHIDASWCCLKFEPAPDVPGAMIARFKAAMKTGGQEERDRARWTLGMLLSTMDQMSAGQRMMATMIESFAQHFGGIDHISELNPEPPPS